ncbi:hypothetical protein [Leptospira noguchii]|uniref:Uncharacterized protein n=1 Tax=Leptospira noguchii TaxID=28182 RepID=A0AAE9GMP3_9LEPT|nr:hypothetical protein [Leptospira noguchii]UOG47243.1 hypothetical protein MAL01_19430 [Leptospira noguchii]UOG58915.1 hypothetical protein MAL03_20770 [Leptospira noguchii]
MDKELFNTLSKSIHLDELSISVGQEYTVFGIIFWEDIPRFYICDNLEDEYPTPYPSFFFEVVDETLPIDWKLSVYFSNGKVQSQIVFKEWAEDKMFYEKLVDGSEKEIQIFNSYKAKYS